ncbi:MAG: hypothetical protein V1651_02590 [Patescibacteria group bacterium]
MTAELKKLVLTGEARKEFDGPNGPYTLIIINGHPFIDRLTCSVWNGPPPKIGELVQVWDIIETFNGYRALHGKVAPKKSKEFIFLANDKNNDDSAKRIAELEAKLSKERDINRQLNKENNTLLSQYNEEKNEQTRLREIIGEIPQKIEELLQKLLA